MIYVLAITFFLYNNLKTKNIYIYMSKDKA